MMMRGPGARRPPVPFTRLRAMPPVGDGRCRQGGPWGWVGWVGWARWGGKTRTSAAAAGSFVLSQVCTTLQRRGCFRRRQ